MGPPEGSGGSPNEKPPGKQRARAGVAIVARGEATWGGRAPDLARRGLACTVEVPGGYFTLARTDDR